MSHRLRVIFAGTPDFAASHLQALLDDGRHDIVAVYSQPDRPSGRGKKLKPSPVKQVALDNHISVYQPLHLKDADIQAEFAALNADLMIVVAYGLLLPQAILDTPRLGCINVHASLLPRWRGAAPIQRAIEAGDNETGVTIMQMDIGLDTGAMLMKARCDISPTETGGSLHDKLIDVGRPALLDTLQLLAEGKSHGEAQDNSLSNYASKMDKSDMLIDWQLDAVTIDRKIRAFNPFPVTYTTLAGERIKIWQAEVIDNSTTNQTIGSITHADKRSLHVSCGQGSLALKTIQLPGAKALEISAIMNSKAELFTVGTVFGQ